MKRKTKKQQKTEQERKLGDFEEEKGSIVVSDWESKISRGDVWLPEGAHVVVSDRKEKRYSCGHSSLTKDCVSVEGGK